VGSVGRGVTFAVGLGVLIVRTKSPSLSFPKILVSTVLALKMPWTSGVESHSGSKSNNCLFGNMIVAIYFNFRIDDGMGWDYCSLLTDQYVCS